MLEGVSARCCEVEHLAELDAAARNAVEGADTFFAASSSGEDGGAAGGVDVSRRGGRPGFVRMTSAGVLEIPDFRGNGYFNTLGNMLLDPRAALTFPDFASGDVLHLSGRAEMDWTAAGAVHGAERVWRLQVERGWRPRGALPWRWAFRDCAPTTIRTGIWRETEASR